MCLPLGRRRKVDNRVRDRRPVPRFHAGDTTASLGPYLVEPWGQSLPLAPSKSPLPISMKPLPPTPTESPPPSFSTTSLSGGAPNSPQAALAIFNAQRQQQNQDFESAQQRIFANHDSRREVLEGKLASWSLHAERLRVEVRIEWDKLLSNFHDEFDEVADATLKQRVADWTREMSTRVVRFRTDSTRTFSEATQALDQALSGRRKTRFLNLRSKQASASRTQSFEAAMSNAYLSLGGLISAPLSSPASGLYAPAAPAAVSYDTLYYGHQLERGRLVPSAPGGLLGNLPGPSSRLPDYSEYPETPLAHDASLIDVQTWCTRQFLGDQQSRAYAYRDAQASLDEDWIQQQIIVGDSVKSINAQFQELVQTLAEEKSKIWQQVAQTDALSRETIDAIFLRTATGALNETMRAVIGAMDSYCFEVRLVMRRPELRWEQGATPLAGCHSFGRGRPGNGDSRSGAFTYQPAHQFGPMALFTLPRIRALPTLGPMPAQRHHVNASWLTEQDRDNQFSAAQLGRQKDNESLEQRRQLTFNSKLEEWDEAFVIQLQKQRAGFNDQVSLLKRERREYMRRLYESLLQRIDEANHCADNIVDDRLRECRIAVVETAASLEKAALWSLGLAASNSPD